MPVQDLIEQLSFGSSLPKMSSCLGIFLHPEAIFLCEAACENSRPRVLHLLRIPVPSTGPSKDTRVGGSLNTDFLSDAGRLPELLRNAMAQARWSSKFAMVTLSHHFGILRYFTLPSIERRFWHTAIPAEAMKHIPLPFATLLQDFQVNTLPNGTDMKPRLGCLFGVTPRRNMEGLQNIVSKLGLDLVGVELAPMSAARLIRSIDPLAAAPYAQAHFDGGDIRILICNGELPILYRETLLGREATSEESRKVDIAGCIDFARKLMGSATPIPLRVSGQIANLDSWRTAFSQEIGAPVTLNELHQPLGIKAGQWGVYAAVGAALRPLAPTPLVLNLSGSNRISDEDRRAAFAIFKLGGLLCLFFLCMGIYGFIRAWIQSARLAKVQKSVAVAEEFRGKSKDDIEQLVAQMRTKADSFGSATARQVPLTRVLQALTESIPEAVWVTNLNYANPLNSADVGRTERTLTITGNAMAPSPAAEQDLIFRFAENLRKNATFLEAYPLIEPSVQKFENTSENDASGLDPASTEANQEKRTQFVIQCANRRGT